jgi:hypothetical protein
MNRKFAQDEMEVKVRTLRKRVRIVGLRAKIWTRELQLLMQEH